MEYPLVWHTRSWHIGLSGFDHYVYCRCLFIAFAIARNPSNIVFSMIYNLTSLQIHRNTASVMMLILFNSHLPLLAPTNAPTTLQPIVWNISWFSRAKQNFSSNKTFDQLLSEAFDQLVGSNYDDYLQDVSDPHLSEIGCNCARLQGVVCCSHHLQH